MPDCRDQVTAEICIELQIATAKAIRCIKNGYYDKALAHLRSCNPFFKALEADSRIADLDSFLRIQCVGSVR